MDGRRRRAREDPPEQNPAYSPTRLPPPVGPLPWNIDHPHDANQVAFHPVERRLDGPTGKQQFTPIAVLIRPGAKCVLGKSADMQEWVPYPELLKSLTGRVEGRKNSAEQSAVTATFVKKTLAQLRSTPTLVLAHAQDVRKRWPWLRNDGLERDRLGLDGGPTQRIGLYGKQLRVVRIADGSRDETAECWAEAEEFHPELEGQQCGGIAMGLCRPGVRGDSDRVFYSTTGKSGTQTKLTNDDAKLNLAPCETRGRLRSASRDRGRRGCGGTPDVSEAW